MPVLLGIILGIALTVGGAYLYDSTDGRAANGLGPTAAGGQAPMVNWSVVKSEWQTFESNVRAGGDNLERAVKRHAS